MVKKDVSKFSKFMKEDLKNLQEIYERFSWREDQEKALSDAGFSIILQFGAKYEGEETDERLWINRTGDLLVWDNYIDSVVYLLKALKPHELTSAFYRIYNKTDCAENRIDLSVDDVEKQILDEEFILLEKNKNQKRYYGKKKVPQEELIILDGDNLSISYFKRLDTIEI